LDALLASITSIITITPVCRVAQRLLITQALSAGNATQIAKDALAQEKMCVPHAKKVHTS